MLEERIAIEELNNNNKATREAISLLESKMSELEQKLKETSQARENSEPTKETMPEAREAHETFEETTPEIMTSMPEETEEETVTVTALEDNAPQQEHSENLNKQSEKKRRRIF